MGMAARAAYADGPKNGHNGETMSSIAAIRKSRLSVFEELTQQFKTEAGAELRAGYLVALQYKYGIAPNTQSRRVPSIILGSAVCR